MSKQILKDIITCIFSYVFLHKAYFMKYDTLRSTKSSHETFKLTQCYERNIQVKAKLKSFA